MFRFLGSSLSIILLVLALAWCRTVHAEITPPVPVNEPSVAWPPGHELSNDLLLPVVLLVSVEGEVVDAKLEARIGEPFDTAALVAARSLRFVPARDDVGPKSAKIRLLMRFRAVRPGTSAPAAGTAETAASGSEQPPAPDAARAGSAEPSPTAASSSRDSLHPEIEVVGERVAPVRSASEITRGQEVIRAAPHRTGGDLLQVVPGVFITQHSGQGKAYQVFYRGFDAVHGQDLEFWVGGAPVNEVSNIHGQGYADLHFVMPEVVTQMRVLPGNYSPEQGDFAVAGTIRYDLGFEEPGVTAKATLGSFGERRVFLAYHPQAAEKESFAAFEAQSTNGFGASRAAQRTSAIAQHALQAGQGKLRLLLTGYAGSFASPGVVRLADLESGALGRLETYGVDQGGFSSRYQAVLEYREAHAGSDWSIAPYAVLRSLKLKQNYTGYLVDEDNGDTTQLINDSTTVGVAARYRKSVSWLSARDAIEAGVSLRNDWVSQSQLDVSAGGSKVLSTIVNAKLRALDAAGWLDLAVSPVRWLNARAGLRVDALSFNVRDNTPASESRAGSDPNAFARQLRPPSPGGQARTAMGMHYGPRLTIDGLISPGLHGVFAYGEGFRSPQARSLGNGEKTPFTLVRSFEAGVRLASDTLTGSVAAFRTQLHDDLVFDAATTRNEAVPGSLRMGGALEFTIKPRRWFVSSGSFTYTRATFTGSNAEFHSGDRLPYVPELIIRQDLAFIPTLTQLWSRDLTGRFGTALTGMFNRPQPYGAFGHDVFLVDAIAELRLREVAVGLELFNLLNADWYDSEFTYSANWSPGSTARLVPERYVTVGAPRSILATLSLFLN